MTPYEIAEKYTKDCVEFCMKILKDRDMVQEYENGEIGHYDGIQDAILAFIETGCLDDHFTK